MNGLGIFLVGTMLFVAGLVVLSFLQKSRNDCGCSGSQAEGFVDAAAGAAGGSQQLQADLSSILKLARRVGGTLLDPSMWQMRYEMIGKDPVELARMHLKSVRKAE